MTPEQSNVIRQYLRDRFPALHDVDDLVQEAYARVLRARAAGRVIHPKAYLFATALSSSVLGIIIFIGVSQVSARFLRHWHESSVLREA